MTKAKMDGATDGEETNKDPTKPSPEEKTSENSDSSSPSPKERRTKNEMMS
jgi:hypothetical protein